MDGTPVAAYWLGFIFADGCFFGNRLQIALSSKDLGHLERLRDWIGYGRVSTEREGRVCRYAVLDSATVPALRARFDLKPRKTENPPSRVPFEDNELLMCWLTGFIDGDGHIRRQTGRQTAILNIVGHQAWKPFFVELSEKLDMGWVYERTGSGYSDPDRAYAVFGVAKHNDLVALKRAAIKNNLPFLERKWGVVDCSIHIDRWEKAERIRTLIRDGWRTTDIAKEVGCSKPAVSIARHRMREVKTYVRILPGRFAYRSRKSGRNPVSAPRGAASRLATSRSSNYSVARRPSRPKLGRRSQT